MLTTVEIGRGEFRFPAAHSGLHDGAFETLHGHTFQVSLRLSGTADGAGMLVDFRMLKKALRETLAPLRRRTLMPGNAPAVHLRRDGGSISISDGAKCYVLPAQDVTVLPVINTSTEALANYLLEQICPFLAENGVSTADLTLAEAPGLSATAHANLTEQR